MRERRNSRGIGSRSYLRFDANRRGSSRSSAALKPNAPNTRRRRHYVRVLSGLLQEEGFYDDALRGRVNKRRGFIVMHLLMHWMRANAGTEYVRRGEADESRRCFLPFVCIGRSPFARYESSRIYLYVNRENARLYQLIFKTRKEKWVNRETGFHAQLL